VAKSRWPRIQSVNHVFALTLTFDGDNPKQLTYNKFEGFGGLAGDLTPDGKWVVYSNQGGEKGIWMVSIEAANPFVLPASRQVTRLCRRTVK